MKEREKGREMKEREGGERGREMREKGNEPVGCFLEVLVDFVLEDGMRCGEYLGV